MSLRAAPELVHVPLPVVSGDHVVVLEHAMFQRKKYWEIQMVGGESRRNPADTGTAMAGR